MTMLVTTKHEDSLSMVLRAALRLKDEVGYCSCRGEPECSPFYRVGQTLRSAPTSAPTKTFAGSMTRELWIPASAGTTKFRCVMTECRGA